MPLSPLVLVENERTVGGLYDHWQNASGERYQYPNQYKNKIVPGRPAVEVKATVGAAFPNFEITANEWNAAQKLRHLYKILLVASASTNNPDSSDDQRSLYADRGREAKR